VIRFCQNQTRIIASIQNFQYSTAKNLDSSISKVTRLCVGRPTKSGSIPTRGKRFFSSPSVQAPSGVHPASCSMGTGGSSPSVKLGAHLCLVLMSIMSTAVPPCLWRPSSHMQGQLIFTVSYCQHKVKISCWHQHRPFSTSQPISEDSNQHTAHSLQIPAVYICTFFKFWGLRWVGYIYVYVVRWYERIHYTNVDNFYSQPIHSYM
jgi:hypothetical protein